MTDKKVFDVIIAGGSYAGLAAAMALGRSLRTVLVIDSGMPCNRHTPYSHNFITHDGKTPREILTLARAQVTRYDTVTFERGIVSSGKKTDIGFEIHTTSGNRFHARKLIFATGIRDVMPDIPGYAECWGISVLHCPYCHGYEVRNTRTGLLGNGDYGFEFSGLISNWTNDLTLYTNGKATLSAVQRAILSARGIEMVEKEIEALEHRHGQLRKIIFRDGTTVALQTLYARNSFAQHCPVPEMLGCDMLDGYIAVDGLQKTSVPGVFACGDNASRMRTVANAVGSGTTAGMTANKEFVLERFASPAPADLANSS